MKGAFSLVLLTHDSLIAVRDPNGFRPLTLGRLDGSRGSSRARPVRSTSSAPQVERDLEPGRGRSSIRRGRVRSAASRSVRDDAANTFCVFEYIYFARPDSNLQRTATSTRSARTWAALLAREHPVKVGHGRPAARLRERPRRSASPRNRAFPYETALIRNHFVQRTFIEPTQSIRDFRVRVKHNAVRGLVEGKRVLLVDDSIVRGTTLRKIVTMIREAGAREVHLRVSSPPTVGPCHYGIDTPTREELIAHNHTPREICEMMGADSLEYLSIDGLRKTAASSVKRGMCDACFSDEYPLDIEDEKGAPQLSLFRALEDER